MEEWLYACGGDVGTSVSGVVAGEMMLVIWCSSFGVWCAAIRTHAGGAFGGDDRRRCSITIQNHKAEPRTQRCLHVNLDVMLMLCLREKYCLINYDSSCALSVPGWMIMALPLLVSHVDAEWLWTRSGSAVECPTLERGNTVTNPPTAYTLAPLMATRCGVVTPWQHKIITCYFVINRDLIYYILLWTPWCIV